MPRPSAGFAGRLPAPLIWDVQNGSRCKRFARIFAFICCLIAGGRCSAPEREGKTRNRPRTHSRTRARTHARLEMTTMIFPVVRTRTRVYRFCARARASEIARGGGTTTPQQQQPATTADTQQQQINARQSSRQAGRQADGSVFRFGHNITLAALHSFSCTHALVRQSATA